MATAFSMLPYQVGLQMFSTSATATQYQRREESKSSVRRSYDRSHFDRHQMFEKPNRLVESNRTRLLATAYPSFDHGYKSPIPGGVTDLGELSFASMPPTLNTKTSQANDEVETNNRREISSALRKSSCVMINDENGYYGNEDCHGNDKSVPGYMKQTIVSLQKAWMNRESAPKSVADKYNSSVGTSSAMSAVSNRNNNYSYSYSFPSSAAVCNGKQIQLQTANRYQRMSARERPGNYFAGYGRDSLNTGSNNAVHGTCYSPGGAMNGNCYSLGGGAMNSYSPVGTTKNNHSSGVKNLSNQIETDSGIENETLAAVDGCDEFPSIAASFRPNSCESKPGSQQEAPAPSSSFRRLNRPGRGASPPSAPTRISLEFRRLPASSMRQSAEKYTQPNHIFNLISSAYSSEKKNSSQMDRMNFNADVISNLRSSNDKFFQRVTQSARIVKSGENFTSNNLNDPPTAGRSWSRAQGNRSGIGASAPASGNAHSPLTNRKSISRCEKPEMTFDKPKQTEMFNVRAGFGKMLHPKSPVATRTCYVQRDSGRLEGEEKILEGVKITQKPKNVTSARHHPVMDRQRQSSPQAGAQTGRIDTAAKCRQMAAEKECEQKKRGVEDEDGDEEEAAVEEEEEDDDDEEDMMKTERILEWLMGVEDFDITDRLPSPLIFEDDPVQTDTAIHIVYEAPARTSIAEKERRILTRSHDVDDKLTR